MIRVCDLERRHPGASAPVLDGVSFELPAGALAVVLGPSGAGKTTLLRCLAGLDSFQAGSIDVDDLHVAANGAGRRELARMRARLRGRVGIVFQTLELFPHLTVLENCVLAPIHVARVPRDEAESLARALLERLGLADKAGEYPQRMSGGQCQRAAIARALAMEPRVLLYDEPTSALDPSLKQEVWQTAQRVRASGVTQLIVTHDAEIARHADVVFTIDAGRLAERR